MIAKPWVFVWIMALSALLLCESFGLMNMRLKNGALEKRVEMQAETIERQRTLIDCLDRENACWRGGSCPAEAQK